MPKAFGISEYTSPGTKHALGEVISLDKFSVGNDILLHNMRVVVDLLVILDNTKRTPYWCSFEFEVASAAHTRSDEVKELLRNGISHSSDPLLGLLTGINEAEGAIGREKFIDFGRVLGNMTEISGYWDTAELSINHGCIHIEGKCEARRRSSKSLHLEYNHIDKLFHFYP